jgi:glycosyltransferase involved in cell wall biosynthesis
VPEIVLDGLPGLVVPPGDDEAFAAALARLAADPMDDGAWVLRARLVGGSTRTSTRQLVISSRANSLVSRRSARRRRSPTVTYGCSPARNRLAAAPGAINAPRLFTRIS